MTGSGKLDMSLDDLIKKARSKPAAAGGAKKAAGQQGAAKKKTAVGNKGGAAGGQKQPQQKAGAKGKLTQMKQVKQAPVQQQKQGLKAKGGIQKAGGGGAPRPGANKLQPQQRPGARRADVRVVPRLPAGRAGGPPGGPRPTAGGRGGMMRPVAQPRYMGPAPGQFMGGGPQMMMLPPPMMMMQQQQPMQQQPMMAQQQMQQPQQQSAKWNSDLFDGSVVSSKTSAKLLVSNLDFKVTDEDVKELFGTVGTIKESYIHYDKNGRSLGTATVVFQDRQDALNAFNRYNNVALDNKRMAIEVVEQAVPRGTFKTLASGINVSRPQAGGASYKGRGVPQGGDMMME